MIKIFSVFIVFSLLNFSITLQLFNDIKLFLMKGNKQLNNEIRNQQTLRSEYDFIIVGAGTAGCVLANRLSENPNWNILLIEAGQHENLFMDIPVLVLFLPPLGLDWGFKSEQSNSSCLGMIGNQCNLVRGKVMGGSSILNYMIYTRGNRKDYDRWADLGNYGWSYDEVLPYFKKLENSLIPDTDPGYAGHGGPLTISYVKYRTSVAKAFIKAGIETGHPNIDYNGASQIGTSYIQMSIKDGYRHSSNSAYLYPIKDRSNLHVKKLSEVTKIIFDQKTRTAIGVTFKNGNKLYTIKAKKEVILSAGAINSPQLLMLSGIGPAAHLIENKIKPIIDLPVGYNLMDHAASGGLVFLTNQTTITTHSLATAKNINLFVNKGEGQFGSPGPETISFYDLNNPTDPNGYPDIELFQYAGSFSIDPVVVRNCGFKQELYEYMYKPLEKIGVNSFMIFPMVLRPKSRGRILLRSNEYRDHPIIKPNYYENYDDMKTAIRGIKKTLELINTDAFRKINATLVPVQLPTCKQFIFASDAYWECLTRHFTMTIYHYSGTCKMGHPNDRTAVVDPRLKVKGIKNLRVVDASVMPEIITGHTNGPVFMIAEKASDMIKEDWLANNL